MSPRTFIWNEGAGRFIDAATRQFVAGAKVRGALDDYLDSKSLQARDLSQQLQRREITLAQWQKGMERAITTNAINAAALARGGREKLDEAALAKTGAFIKSELAYLEKFAVGIESGTPTDGRFQNRTRQFMQAARTHFHDAQREEMDGRGFDEERSIRHARDSCAGCSFWANAGWQPLGTVTLPGERDCRRNCRCTLEYRVKAPSASSPSTEKMAGGKIDLLTPENKRILEQDHPFSPSGTPISQAFELTEISPKFKDREWVMKALDKVMGDGKLDSLAPNVITGGSRGGKYTAGSYRGGTSPSMGLNLNDNTPGNTTLHEIAHWLHDRVLGFDPYDPSYKMGNFDAMTDIVNSLENTDPIRRLKELRAIAENKKVKNKIIGYERAKGRETKGVEYDIDKNHLTYLLKPDEIFARAFAQHVAMRSGNDRLLTELQFLLKKPPTTDLGGMTPESLFYPMQWHPEEFGKASQIFDKLLLTKGWIKPT